MKKLTILGACLSVLSGIVTAQAGFIVDPNPGGTSLNLASAMGVTTSSGAIGSEIVNITSPQLFDSASGAASIQPAGQGTLTSLTFTPLDNTAFDAFSFRGQLDTSAGGSVLLQWVASDGLTGEFVFDGLGANSNFGRVGIYSIDGETLQSVTLSAAGEGFHSVKQIQLSPTGPDAVAVPEPGSSALFGMGLVGLVKMVRRKRKMSKADVSV